MRELSESKKLKLDTILGKVLLISLIGAILIAAFAGIYFFMKVDSKKIEEGFWIVSSEVKKLENIDKETGLLNEPVSQSILMFKSKSFGLLVGIFFTFGCSICLIFAEARKYKPVLYYVLKCASLVLIVGFIIFVGIFDGMFLTTDGIKIYQEYDTTLKIIGYAGLAVLVVNIVASLINNTILGFEE